MACGKGYENHEGTAEKRAEQRFLNERPLLWALKRAET